MASISNEKQYQEFLDNKLKAKVIIFFLHNSHRAFQLSELEKKLSSRSLAAHLQALVKIGFLNSFSKKSQRFYILNKKNKQLSEWKTAVARKFKNVRKPEDDLVKSLQRIPSLKAAVLSGVFMGNGQQECDLVLAGDLSKRTLDNLVQGIEKAIGQELNYALFDFKEYEYRKHTFDRFMKDIFDNPHFVVLDKTK